MIHAEEVLLVAIFRSLPPDIRSKVADDFREQVEIAETSHLGSMADRQASDAFKAHVRRQWIVLVLASLSEREIDEVEVPHAGCRQGVNKVPCRGVREARIFSARIGCNDCHAGAC